MVANLVKERDYYKESFIECQAIIKQLAEGPGDIEYIHPFDMYDILNSTDASEFIDVYTGPKDERTFTLGKSGKKYKQSQFIPAKSKNFK